MDTWIDKNLRGRIKRKKGENSLILRMVIYYKIQKKSRVLFLDESITRDNPLKENLASAAIPLCIFHLHGRFRGLLNMKQQRTYPSNPLQAKIP